MVLLKVGVLLLVAGNNGVKVLWSWELLPLPLPLPSDFFFSFGDFLPDLPSFDFNSGVLAPEDLLDWELLPFCLTLFLDLIVSVFKLIGLGRPCNFKNNPQALHNTWPVSSLRHKGVVWVWQFPQTGPDMEILLEVADEVVVELELELEVVPVLGGFIGGVGNWCCCCCSGGGGGFDDCSDCCCCCCSSLGFTGTSTDGLTGTFEMFSIGEVGVVVGVFPVVAVLVVAAPVLTLVDAAAATAAVVVVGIWGRCWISLIDIIDNGLL